MQSQPFKDISDRWSRESKMIGIPIREQLMCCSLFAIAK
jgi:hypothetical protein